MVMLAEEVQRLEAEAEAHRMVKLKILSLLTDFPFLSTSMIQSHVHPYAHKAGIDWRKTLKSLLAEGKIEKSSINRTGTDRDSSLTVYKLA